MAIFDRGHTHRPPAKSTHSPAIETEISQKFFTSLNCEVPKLGTILCISNSCANLELRISDLPKYGDQDDTGVTENGFGFCSPFPFAAVVYTLRCLDLQAELRVSPTVPADPGLEAFREKMSNVGTSKGILEIAKFGVYVTIPIVLMYTFANNTKNIQKFMGNRSYIVYPPEGPRPQSPEELREMARELARKNNTR
ncbi:Protein Pet [Fagus crenata]